jgi:uncharacterized protein with HEPN domain
MRPEAQKLLYDVLSAAAAIEEYLRGKSYDEYEDSGLLQAGVERRFEIIGEAVAQLDKIEPDVAGSLPEHARIIAFRNVLIHAYSGVSPAIVWDIARTKLPALVQAVERLLRRADAEAP